MDAGLARTGRWMIGVALAVAALGAHAQRLYAPSADAWHATLSRAIYEGGGRFAGLRAGAAGAGLRGYPAPMAAPARGRFDASPYQIRRVDARVGDRVDPHYAAGITPVSTQGRPPAHPPADSPVRAGSIREDVARYNEERAAFRPFARDGADTPRPPMPSPYRN